jgi:hypothetical protein
VARQRVHLVVLVDFRRGCVNRIHLQYVHGAGGFESSDNHDNQTSCKLHVAETCVKMMSKCDDGHSSHSQRISVQNL